jgi:hypothetical protein
MAMHTQNVQADPRSSLLVTQPDTAGDPLGTSRVTLLGNVLPVPAPEVAEARKLYLALHAKSKYWVDFDDFPISWYSMGRISDWCTMSYTHEKAMSAPPTRTALHASSVAPKAYSGIRLRLPDIIARPEAHHEAASGSDSEGPRG